ncbi:unnamed protein product, partial [Schistosoma turkestanicum]
KHVRASIELQGLTTQYIWSCVQHEVYCVLLTHLNNITPTELNELSLSSNKNGLFKLQARISKIGIAIDGEDVTTTDNDHSSATLDLSKVDLNALMGRKRIGAFNFASITGSSSTTTSTTTNTTTNTTSTASATMISTNTNTIPTTATITNINSTTTTTTTRDNQSNMNTITGNITATNPTVATNQGQSNNNVPLFSFSNASHYLGVSTYLSESRAMSGLPGVDSQTGQTMTEKSAPIYPLACRPSGDNILSVYKMVMEFIEAVEWEMIKYTEFSDLHSVNHSDTGGHDDRQRCQLRTQLKNFIENIYLPGKLSSLRNKLQRSLN